MVQLSTVSQSHKSLVLFGISCVSVCVCVYLSVCVGIMGQRTGGLDLNVVL